MRCVRAMDNKSTERKLIKYFHEHHIVGWRRHYNVKGHPDFVFLNKKLLFSLTDVFGMDTIAEIHVRQIIKNIGKIKGKKMFYMIGQLQQDLSLAGGP